METDEIKRRLAVNLKMLRKRRKLTQMELALLSDCSENTIKSIELCRVWPSDRILSRISAALKIDVFQLFSPVSLSCAQTAEIKRRLKSAVCDNIRTYVDVLLEKTVMER